MKLMIVITVYILINFFNEVSCLSCYQCVSTQPGCGSTLDWRWHWSYTCEDNNDKCVKIIETKGAEDVITRSCLSNLQFLRHDIPADQYEGCRKASYDVKLAHYVNNTIKQLDIKRNYYDNVQWCFCEFDHFCNDARGLKFLKFLVLLPLLTLFNS